MRVGVGSDNPVKRDAVTEVLGNGDDEYGTHAGIEAVPVESGVSDQPRGHTEPIRGAETRAENVLDVDAYEFAVGIEGGVGVFEGFEGLSLVMWAAVDDGAVVGRGSGPSMRLPEAIERRVRAGEELGPVMDDVLGEHEVAENQGAVGAFTNGRVDRREAFATAVAGTLGPFVTDLY